MNFSCCFCQGRIEATEVHFGLVVPCPHCGKELAVPSILDPANIKSNEADAPALQQNLEGGVCEDLESTIDVPAQSARVCESNIRRSRSASAWRTRPTLRVRIIIFGGLLAGFLAFIMIHALHNASVATNSTRPSGDLTIPIIGESFEITAKRLQKVPDISTNHHGRHFSALVTFDHLPLIIECFDLDRSPQIDLIVIQFLGGIPVMNEIDSANEATKRVFDTVLRIHSHLSLSIAKKDSEREMWGASDRSAACLYIHDRRKPGFTYWDDEQLPRVFVANRAGMEALTRVDWQVSELRLNDSVQ